MLINRAYYTSTIHFFLKQSSNAILGELSKNHRHDLVQLQTNAWLKQIEILKEQLNTFANSENNTIFFEFGIPRMGKRADVVLVINGLVFVIEFKVGAREYARHNKEQAIDYALDLKHFHQGSHKACIVPVLLATDALTMHSEISINHDGLVSLLCVNRRISR